MRQRQPGEGGDWREEEEGVYRGDLVLLYEGKGHERREHEKPDERTEIFRKEAQNQPK